MSMFKKGVVAEPDLKLRIEGKGELTLSFREHVIGFEFVSDLTKNHYYRGFDRNKDISSPYGQQYSFFQRMSKTIVYTHEFLAQKEFVVITFNYNGMIKNNNKDEEFFIYRVKNYQDITFERGGSEFKVNVSFTHETITFEFIRSGKFKSKFLKVVDRRGKTMRSIAYDFQYEYIQKMLMDGNIHLTQDPSTKTAEITIGSVGGSRIEIKLPQDEFEEVVSNTTCTPSTQMLEYMVDGITELKITITDEEITLQCKIFPTGANYEAKIDRKNYDLREIPCHRHYLFFQHAIEKKLLSIDRTKRDFEHDNVVFVKIPFSSFGVEENIIFKLELVDEDEIEFLKRMNLHQQREIEVLRSRMDEIESSNINEIEDLRSHINEVESSIIMKFDDQETVVIDLLSRIKVLEKAMVE